MLGEVMYGVSNLLIAKRDALSSHDGPGTPRGKTNLRAARAYRRAMWLVAACVVWSRGAVGAADEPAPSIAERLARYAVVKLRADRSHLSKGQNAMVGELLRAAAVMDEIFWREAYGDRRSLLDRAGDRATRRFLEINYGPWDRLDGNRPFLPGVGPKPPGARFYPADMTREAFQSYVERHASEAAALKSLYTLVRRTPAGQLEAIPYHRAFAPQIGRAVKHLRRAAELCETPSFRRYLLARAKALETDQYRESDMLWMEMKDNPVDIVIGPIETYEDGLFGYKAAHEAYVLIKDLSWSRRLQRYAAMLPEWQKKLPVPDRYKRETPGRNADLNAYDVIYYAGDCNAGSKTIAINLPNDEVVQLEKGTRRLQLKNAMRAKFDRIMVPISKVLIVPEQQQHVTFAAFFGNTMFHEVAHGLGIKFTLDGHQPVRQALRDAASTIEEGKADILGLFIITELADRGALEEGVLEDYYVTFLAGIFRSVRFGAASAHGRANMIRFHVFQDAGAFVRDDAGRYRVDMPRMREAVRSLSRTLLTLQGDGDYAGARKLIEEKGRVSGMLQADLDRVEAAKVPVDIIFEMARE